MLAARGRSPGGWWPGCDLGLGSVALVPLAEAREKAVANRKLARSGGDPLADKRRLQSIPMFAEATTAD